MCQKQLVHPCCGLVLTHQLLSLSSATAHDYRRVGGAGTRLFLILLAGLALLSGGCSVYMARSGQDLSPLATRDQVQQEFGLPAETGTTTDGQAYEDYRTRRKISEETRSYSMGMGIGMTCGLLEFFYFPTELYNYGRRFWVGQTVRFEYDATGKVCGLKLNDHVLSRTRLQSAKSKVTATPPK